MPTTRPRFLTGRRQRSDLRPAPTSRPLIAPSRSSSRVGNHPAPMVWPDCGKSPNGLALIPADWCRGRGFRGAGKCCRTPQSPRARPNVAKDSLNNGLTDICYQCEKETILADLEVPDGAQWELAGAPSGGVSGVPQGDSGTPQRPGDSVLAELSVAVARVCERAREGRGARVVDYKNCVTPPEPRAQVRMWTRNTVPRASATDPRLPSGDGGVAAVGWCG